MAAKLIMQLLGETAAPSLSAGSFTTSLVNSKTGLAQGTGDQEYTSVSRLAVTVAASGTESLDLMTAQSVVNEDMVVGTGSLAAILIVNQGDGDLEIKPNVTNGFTSLLGAGSVVKLPAGCALMIDGLTLAAYPISATNKVLDFTEVGGVNTAAISIEFWTRV